LVYSRNERSAAALASIRPGQVIAAAIIGALAAWVGPVYANYVLVIDP